MRPQHIGIRGIERGGLHRSPEHCLRVVHQVRVERIVRGDEYGYPVGAGASSAPGLLP